MVKTGLLTIWEMIAEGGQDPDQNAIESPGYLPLTYRELRAQIQSVVRTLNSMGFHRNDRIAIIIPAGPEAAVSIVSVMAGFTVVPLNPQNKEQEFADIFSQIRIKAIIVQKDRPTAATTMAVTRNIPVIELVPVSHTAGKFELLPAVSPNVEPAEFATPSDIAYVLLTSGTTSTSKIVPVSQKQSAISKQKTCSAGKITSSDRCLHVVPYHHGMGIGTPLLVTLIAGGTVICTQDFIPPDFLHLLITYRPTYFTAGPALHTGILRELKKRPSDDFHSHSLRYIRTGSGFLPMHVREELESLLKVPVIEAYGMSEAGTLAMNIPPKKGSVGIPFIDSIKIFDEQDHPLETNRVGEVVITGETVFSGYENAPDENRSAFTDGWFRTGDLGYLDDDGYLFLTGRKKDLINKGGEKISMEEIDSVLLSHQGVREAMAFPVHDPVLGEDIEAIVVPANDMVTEQDLRSFLLDRLVHFKVPRRICFVDAIPRNSAGKPLRYQATQQYS